MRRSEHDLDLTIRIMDKATHALQDCRVAKDYHD
jgi:hypothetical protein